MSQETPFRIIPKPKPKAPLFINTLFGVSLSLFLLSGLLYGFLFYQESVIEKKIKDIDSKMLALESADNKKAESEISSLSLKINNFSKLLQTRPLASNIFLFLKTSCHPKVQLTEASFDQAALSLTLRGITEDFKTLAEAMLKWQNDSRVASTANEIVLSNIALNKEGKVDFSLQFNLKSTLFSQ